MERQLRSATRRPSLDRAAGRSARGHTLAYDASSNRAFRRGHHGEPWILLRGQDATELVSKWGQSRPGFKPVPDRIDIHLFEAHSFGDLHPGFQIPGILVAAVWALSSLNLAPERAEGFSSVAFPGSSLGKYLSDLAKA